jgi:hypothetical protein
MIPERLTLGFRLDLESIELACEKWREGQVQDDSSFLALKKWVGGGAVYEEEDRVRNRVV